MPLSFKTELIEKKQLTDNVYFFNFKLIDPCEIEFKGGQYVFFKINNLTRLYSIASGEQTKNRIELIIKTHTGGVASEYFSQLQVGTAVDIFGPAGFFRLNNNSKKKMLIAFGTGITPFFSILKSLNSDASIELFWGLKTAKDTYGIEDLRQIADQHKNFKYNICLSQQEDFSQLDGRVYRKGRINEYVIDKDSMDCEYYLCGQQEVIMATNLFLLGSGVSRENIFFEIY